MEPAYYSPKGPLLSEALDFTDSVRFSKIGTFRVTYELQRKEVLRLLSDRREQPISNSPYSGSNPSAPANQSKNWRLCSHKSHKLPPIAGFFELAADLQAPTSHNSEAKNADSLRRMFEIFPFLGDCDRRLGSICTAWPVWHGIVRFADAPKGGERVNSSINVMSRSLRPSWVCASTKT